MITNGQKYLINIDGWIIAPDGESYRAIWGVCQLVNIKEIFGFDVIRPSTNWFLQIGENEKEVIVAGCKIHYAVRCNNKPLNGFTEAKYIDKDSGLLCSANKIYCTE